ncbi:hypothetical protein HAX54_034118 [Datura stramonium]|uniref:Ubiquitin-like protease family profile domain-containing protein n=1 Tax=Datura stramonium TaxID=4076 RepID=A0ABS8Y6T7_DATST|nr:hypothetical protein [Datura stramonium]
MPEHTAQTHVGDVHLEDLNMSPSQFELPDELLPNLNPERSIIIHPNVNIQEEVTLLPMQRCRRPGRWNTSPHMSIFGSSTDSATSATKGEDLVCEYINGYRLYVVVPWHTVDSVFIRINVKDKLHWVLAVLSLRDRCIYIYDSLRSAGHDAAVKREIEKLPQFLPMYLSTTYFYKKKGITSSTHPRYNIQTPSDAFEVTYVDNIPQRKSGSIYASILWDYTTKKLEVESMSDDEAPPKKIRPVSSSSYRIVLS